MHFLTSVLSTRQYRNKARKHLKSSFTKRQKQGEKSECWLGSSGVPGFFKDSNMTMKSISIPHDHTMHHGNSLNHPRLTILRQSVDTTQILFCHDRRCNSTLVHDDSFLHFSILYGLYHNVSSCCDTTPVGNECSHSRDDEKCALFWYSLLSWFNFLSRQSPCPFYPPTRQNHWLWHEFRWYWKNKSYQEGVLFASQVKSNGLNWKKRSCTYWMIPKTYSTQIFCFHKS